MMIDTCSWDAPGHDPYVRDFAAWVVQVPIPAAAKAELIAKVAKNDYADVVYISRDHITSANPALREFKYDPELTYMAFGGKGRICSTVSRAKWSMEELQSAMVFCTENGICVARPSICNNWSLVFRRSGPPATPPVVPPLAETPPSQQTPPEKGKPPENAIPPGACYCLCEGGGWGWYVWGGGGGGGGEWGGFGGGGGGGSSWNGGGSPQTPPVTPAIPEPETYALMFVGLLLVAFRRRKKQM